MDDALFVHLLKRCILALPVYLLGICMPVSADPLSLNLDSIKTPQTLQSETHQKPQLKKDLFQNETDFKRFLKIIESRKAAARGGQDLGGGNSYEVEVREISNWLLIKLEKLNAKLPVEDQIVSTKALAQAISEVTVIFTQETLWLGGEERQALNSLEHKFIVIKESYWLTLDERNKRQLVLHELLRFCNVDDSKNLVSGRLLANFHRTLIPEYEEDIYHDIATQEIDLRESLDEETFSMQRPVRIDGLRTSIRLQYTDSSTLGLRIIVLDPVLGGKTVWFYLSPESRDYTESDFQKAQACKTHIQEGKPVNFFEIAEKNRTIVSCGLSK